MRILLFFLIIFTTFSACSRRFKNFKVLRLTSTDRQIHKIFKEKTVKPHIFYTKIEGRKLRGWEIGADSLPVSFLIHGAPSSMVKFRRWFADSTLFSKTKLVAVDRPGYGKSGYGRAEKSIEKQAKILAPLLEKYSAGKKVVLFGSSYGGSVAVKLAMDYPEKVGGLVLLSASTLPGAEKTPKMAHRIKKTPLGWIAPRWAKVATKEKFAHEKALHEIQDGWDKIRCPVWILHGQNDSLIYFSNAEFTCDKLCETKVEFVPFENMSHNIFWTKMDTVKHYLIQAVNVLNEK